MENPMDEVPSTHGLEHFDAMPAGQTAVIVEPLPLADSTGIFASNQEYTKQLIEAGDLNATLPFPLKNALLTYLDEIDIAASIPGSQHRTLLLTRKIRNLF